MGRHEATFTSGHTGRWRASALGLMEGPYLNCASVWRLYSLWKHQERTSIWGSGRLGEEVLASLWWCIRFNRRTTAAVTDDGTHQIVITGMTFPPRSRQAPTNPHIQNKRKRLFGVAQAFIWFCSHLLFCELLKDCLTKQSTFSSRRIQSNSNISVWQQSSPTPHPYWMDSMKAIPKHHQPQD